MYICFALRLLCALQLRFRRYDDIIFTKFHVLINDKECEQHLYYVFNNCSAIILAFEVVPIHPSSGSPNQKISKSKDYFKAEHF